jgi:hypothetical protein
LRFSSSCWAYENYTRGIYDRTKPSAAFGGTFSASWAVLLGVISLVPRSSVTPNDGAVTYYAQYGRIYTLHARAAAEPRNHMAGTVDCDSRRAFGSTKTILV